jgi:hypothetical protein
MPASPHSFFGKRSETSSSIPKQVRLQRIQQQMVMVAHQHIGMDPAAGAFARLTPCAQKQLPVTVVVKNRLPQIPAVDHLINGSGKWNASFSRHLRQFRPVPTLLSICKA